jgi:hypothetical protein
MPKKNASPHRGKRLVANEMQKKSSGSRIAAGSPDNFPLGRGVLQYAPT